MPLWLFSSGPLSDGREHPDDFADIRAFDDDVRARVGRETRGVIRAQLDRLTNWDGRRGRWPLPDPRLGRRARRRRSRRPDVGTVR